MRNFLAFGYRCLPTQVSTVLSKCFSFNCSYFMYYFSFNCSYFMYYFLILCSQTKTAQYNNMHYHIVHYLPLDLRNRSASSITKPFWRRLQTNSSPGGPLMQSSVSGNVPSSPPNTISVSERSSFALEGRLKYIL